MPSELERRRRYGSYEYDGDMVPTAYGGVPRGAGGLSLKLNYGIRTAKWAKTEVTMRFLVENYP